MQRAGSRLIALKAPTYSDYENRRFELRHKLGYFYKARSVREHLYQRLVVRPLTAILALF